ncbi:MAG: hypothetical protein ACJ8LN_14425 [Sulfurifustis sp.]
MKNLLIATMSAFALSLAVASYAADEAPKGDSKPAPEMKQDSGKKETKKAAKKSKCPEGQIYNKKDKKCVAKAA